MAIAYKSQGAGVSTETSGAALSPLCPATVDAGDILIGHVFWEGTTTAPSTPSGWDLLSGPHVIETTIARHWVFGKIAAGTEDGAAVAFGSPAVTTQRAARIYSFSGRVAGTITELVNGFSHQSHATDPQMPTVTTTKAGALAVALVAQNDNNATGNATGESGGDWVEAVAEYTVALTPGFTLQIQTCQPTANPGTVSGGSVATTNDPCGVIGFQIRDAVPQQADTDVGVLTITGFAPTLSLNVTANPGVGELTINGFAPTTQIGHNVTAGFGTLQFEGFAPSVTVTNNVVVNPGVGETTIVGFAPSLGVGVFAGVGQITIEGFAPTISTPVNVSCGFGSLVFEGFEPEIVIEYGGGGASYKKHTAIRIGCGI